MLGDAADQPERSIKKASAQPRIFRTPTSARIGSLPWSKAYINYNILPNFQKIITFLNNDIPLINLPLEQRGHF